MADTPRFLGARVFALGSPAGDAETTAESPGNTADRPLPCERVKWKCPSSPYPNPVALSRRDRTTPAGRSGRARSLAASRRAELKRSLRRIDERHMLRFERASERWWNKPLVSLSGRILPAELAVLEAELAPGEAGAWMNSRSTATGAVDLILTGTRPAFTTRRIPLPEFVSSVLRDIYKRADLKWGCTDLVIWNEASGEIRLVEVRCPHRNKPTPEQRIFLRVAEEMGIESSVVEWEFASPP